MPNTQPSYIALGPEPTFHAVIYCGLKNIKTGHVHDTEVLAKVCQDYVDKVGLCVSFRVIDYIYTHGREPGVIVGLINYPRFPSTPDIIRRHAMALAERLRAAAEQEHVTVSTNAETVTLQDKSVPGGQSEAERDTAHTIFPHIGDLDVQCVHTRVPFMKELSVRDRETLLMLCHWHLKRHEDIDHKQACARMQERNRQLGMLLKQANRDKWAATDMAEEQRKYAIDLLKRNAELETTIAHMAKLIWWPKIHALARKALRRG